MRICLLLLLLPFTALALDDVSGTTRSKPTTMGALEVSGPIVPPAKTNTANAVYSLDVSASGNVEQGATHAAGTQVEPLRAIFKFDTTNLLAEYKSVSLTVTVSYASPGSTAQSWTIGPYVGNPSADSGADAFLKAENKTRYASTTLFRAPGTYTIDLGPAAVADIKAGVTSIAIRAVNESGTNAYAALTNVATLTVAVTPPGKLWKVDSLTAKSRPMYDGSKYEACMNNSEITIKKICTKAPHWVQIGTINNKWPCESQTIRPLLGPVEYHYLTGLGQGIAACSLQ